MRPGQPLSFETLQSECANYERKGWVLLCGDFNARTNDVNDYIENDELDDYFPIDDTYVSDQHLAKRLTKENSPINANGTAFIEFCKSSGSCIMNGRVDKNNSSNFTCFTNNDHSPIEISIKSSFLIKESDTQPELPVIPLVNLVTSEENKLIQNFKKNTSSMMLQH